MFGEAFVLLVVTFYNLAFIFGKRAYEVFQPLCRDVERGVYHKEILTVTHTLAVGKRECALADGEVIDCIEYIRFTRAVRS